MRRHVVRQDTARVSRVSQYPHDLEQIENTLIGINFRKVIESPLDRSHVDLMYLAAFGKVVHERRDLLVRVHGPFGKYSQIELEAVVGTVDDHLVALVRCENRRGVE